MYEDESIIDGTSLDFKKMTGNSFLDRAKIFSYTYVIVY